ncbi:Sporulation protein YtxC [Alkaliphilus metalliredigens QYMF]|uniref:Sporulation protein YtxC n=1 Tax=Alkaliphilus metalliredigens (strain QYMF) TaxID=293826 RepID=A6TNN8_ALKMQ|nr:putative sporulation protein YtxC [Alkaliphilus metalliredigens]ABR47806.1 Sporulation protein YtxC [Alkaliphilus metalliredigens QYMF]
MNLLAISMRGSVEKLQSNLSKQIESFKGEGILINEKVTEEGHHHIIQYNVNIQSIKNYPISDFINIFKYCTANAISEYILGYEEPRFIGRIISEDYAYFEIKEKLELQKKAFDLLDDESNTLLLSEGEFRNRKTFILEKIVDYFNNNTQIDLMGFVTFRLKDYLMELNEVVERAAEDLLVNKEYSEFIKLLKYFVDIQEPKVDLVHVVLNRENSYELYDKNNNVIENEYLKDVATEIKDRNINYEDILISSLITIAPSEIFIHQVSNTKNHEMIKTIGGIFIDKVKTCEGCEWCTLKLEVKKE